MVTIVFIVLNGIYESRKREKAILNSFKRELNDNKMIMTYNITILKNEIELINSTDKEGVLAPLTPLKSEIALYLILTCLKI